MVRPSALDPPELGDQLWSGFSGRFGWDVGANCGQSVSIMCQLFDRVISFEPCPDSFAFVREHLPFAEIWQLALSDHDGTVELALPPGEQAETGQLVTPGTPGMEWSVEDWSAIPVQQVPCRTADSLAYELGMPDFIKIDTEGHEALVLAGAQEILMVGSTDFLIEFHSEGNLASCVALLEDAGYSGQPVRHPHYEPGSTLWQGHGWLRAFAPRRPIS